MMAAMGRYEHGGDVYSHAGVVDFSASLNPLGMPAEVMAALRERVGEFDIYPDNECRELRAAVAADEGVPERHVLCTAGATDLIERICAAVKPGVALVEAPCFSGYERPLERVGARIERHPLLAREGFALTERIAEDIERAEQIARETDSASALFLCTPNNPTGLTISSDVLERTLEAARAYDVVVLDECFLDFTDATSAVPLVGKYPNLVVMRAFTKLYAMAGLRLGYGICADGALLDRIAEAGQDWAVSTPAQVAGVAALSVKGWKERTRSYVAPARAELAAALEALGMRVVPGEANYLLFESDWDLYEPLLDAGFLIRRCENFYGLDAGYYRVAVRTTSDNRALVAALQEVCR